MNAPNCIYVHNGCPLKVLQKLGAENHPRLPQSLHMTIPSGLTLRALGLASSKFPPC